MFVEETSLDKRLPVKKTANGKLHQERSRERQATKNEDPVGSQAPLPKRKTRKKRVSDKDKTASDGSMSQEEEPLFSHVTSTPKQASRTLPKPPPVRFRNSVYPDSKLPPLRSHGLVGECISDTDRDIASLLGNQQNWYSRSEGHEAFPRSGDFEKAKTTSDRKKRKSTKKEKRIQEQLTKELSQREEQVKVSLFLSNSQAL